MDMSEKFTPGPWRTDYDGHGAISIETEDARQICYVRDEDNARLIAAAPEMLNALQEVIAVAEGTHPRPVMGIDAVRKAIEKATGA
jgi:hypothetical protein